MYVTTNSLKTEKRQKKLETLFNTSHEVIMYIFFVFWGK